MCAILSRVARPRGYSNGTLPPPPWLFQWHPAEPLVVCESASPMGSCRRNLTAAPPCVEYSRNLLKPRSRRRGGQARRSSQKKREEAAAAAVVAHAAAKTQEKADAAAAVRVAAEEEEQEEEEHDEDEEQEQKQDQEQEQEEQDEQGEHGGQEQAAQTAGSKPSGVTADAAVKKKGGTAGAAKSDGSTEKDKRAPGPLVSALTDGVVSARSHRIVPPGSCAVPALCISLLSALFSLLSSPFF